YYARAVPARALSSGPVLSLRLAAVTVFADLELRCSRGINVIIGENGSGKTHLLKCVYALLRAAEETFAPPSLARGGDKLVRVLGSHLHSFFAAEGEPSRVIVECAGARVERVQVPGAPASWSLPPPLRAGAVFFPSREPLAMFPNFTSLYQDYEVSF